MTRAAWRYLLLSSLIGYGVSPFSDKFKAQFFKRAFIRWDLNGWGALAMGILPVTDADAVGL